VHVGLHHHRIQRLVDAAAWLENGREERAPTQLRDAQLHIAGLRRQHPCPRAVALGHPCVGALVAGGTNPIGGFQLDELLQHQTDSITDQINAVTSTERVQQLGQDRLRQGHRRGLLR
jgi:hypothetical protein